MKKLQRVECWQILGGNPDSKWNSGLSCRVSPFDRLKADSGFWLNSAKEQSGADGKMIGELLNMCFAQGSPAAK